MTPKGADALAEALLLLALAFAPFAFGATEGWSRAVLGSLLLAAVLIRIYAYGLPSLSLHASPPALWAILALLSLSTLQSLSQADPSALALSRGLVTASRPLTLEWLKEWAVYAGVLALLPGLYARPGALRRLACFLLATGALLSIVGIAQRQAGDASYYGIRAINPFNRPFGPYPNKDHAAAFLSIAACMGGGLIAAELAIWRRLPRGEGAGEALSRLVVLACMLGVVLAGCHFARSRAGWLALGVAAVVVGTAGLAAAGPLSGRRALLVPPAAALLALAGLHARGLNWTALVPTAGENSLTFRLAMLDGGWRFVRHFPLAGTGLGAFRAVAPLCQTPAIRGYVFDHLHCDPLELAAEAGIPLAVAYCLAVFATLGLSVRAALMHEDPERMLMLGAAAGAGAVFLHSFVEFPTHIASVQAALAVCMAASLGAARAGAAPAMSPVSRPRGPLLLAVATLWFIMGAPKAAGGYFEWRASTFPEPSKTYYLWAAARADETVQRDLTVAAAGLALAEDNPDARLPLLRQALKGTRAALAREPLDWESRRLTAVVLRRLGRGQDALDYSERLAAP